MENQKSKKTNFIIFPLCILSYKADYHQLIKLIIGYGLIETAHRASELYNDKDFYNEESSILFTKNYIKIHKTTGVDISCDFDRVILKTSSYLYLHINNLKTVKEQHKILKDYILNFEERYGKDANVILYTDLLMDILNNNALSEKEFKMLCAVYSKIGKSAYQIIYNNEIRCRFLGYKKQSIINDNKEYQFVFLTDKVIRNTINKLAKRKFFDKIYDGRKNFYSYKLRGKKLSTAIFNKKAKYISNQYNSKYRATILKDRLIKYENSIKSKNYAKANINNIKSLSLC